MDLTKANQARRDAHLDKPIHTRAYGVISLRGLIQRRLADGGRVEAAEYTDHALRAKLEREYALLNRGFHVPWGNERHPTTIKAQALKDRLAGRVTSVEYRLYDSTDGGGYTILSKTAYEYAQQLASERAA